MFTLEYVERLQDDIEELKRKSKSLKMQLVVLALFSTGLVISILSLGKGIEKLAGF